MLRSYTHLVLGGAGMSGISYLGILRFLHTEGYTRTIRHVAGTSIGAFFGALWAIGAPVGDLERYLKEYLSDKEAMHFDVQSCGKHNDRLTRILCEYMPHKMTFLELAKEYGCNLCICASCVETSEPMYFNVDNTPFVEVVEAVKASMSIPYLFDSVVINGRHYVDGGLTCNTPVDAFNSTADGSMLVVQVQESSIQTSVTGLNINQLISMISKNYLNKLPKRGDVLVLKNPPIPFLPFKYSLSALAIDICVTPEDIDTAIGYGFAEVAAFIRASAVRSP